MVYKCEGLNCMSVWCDWGGGGLIRKW